MQNVHIVSVNPALCIGCGLCVSDCPTRTIRMDGKIAVLTTQDCIKCGHCQAICPQSAVSLSGYAEAPEEITPEMHVDPAALLGQLKARRSVRQFSAREIAPELIDQIIEAGRYTPTGTNSQNVSYAVLKEHISDYEAPAIHTFQRLKRVIDLVYSGTRNVQIDDHFLFKNAKAVIVIQGRGQSQRGACRLVDGAHGAVARTRRVL